MSTSLTRRVSAASVGLVLVGALAACGGGSSSSTSSSAAATSSATASGDSSASASSSESSAPAEVTNIKMGINPWIGYAPWYIAQDQGCFTKNNLNVEFQSFKTDADRNAAIVAGQSDVSNVDTGGVIRFVAKDQPVVPIILEDDSRGADAVLSTPDINSAQDLVGKDVAYEFGTTSDLLLHEYLKKNNIDPKTVNSINAPAADAGTLLIAGKAPVVVTYEPYISAATSGDNKGKAKVLYSSADAPGLISDWLVANKDWLANNAAATKALVKCWDEAVAYFNANPKEGTAIMAKGTGVANPDDLTSTLAGVHFYSIAENKKGAEDGSIAGWVKNASEVMTGMGQISAPIDITVSTEYDD